MTLQLQGTGTSWSVAEQHSGWGSVGRLCYCLCVCMITGVCSVSLNAAAEMEVVCMFT